MSNIESKTPKRLEHLTESTATGVAGKWKQNRALSALSHDLGVNESTLKVLFSAHPETEIQQPESGSSNPRYKHSQSDLNKAARGMEHKLAKLRIERDGLTQGAPSAKTSQRIGKLEASMETMKLAIGHADKAVKDRNAVASDTGFGFQKKGPNQSRERDLGSNRPFNALRKTVSATVGRPGGRFVAEGKHYTGVAGNKAGEAGKQTAKAAADAGKWTAGVAKDTASLAAKKAGEARKAVNDGADYVGKKVTAGANKVGNVAVQGAIKAAEKIDSGVKATAESVKKGRDAVNRVAGKISKGVGDLGHAGEARYQSVKNMTGPKLGRQTRYEDFRAAYKAFGGELAKPTDKQVHEFFFAQVLPQLGKSRADYNKDGWNSSPLRSELRYRIGQKEFGPSSNAPTLTRSNALPRQDSRGPDGIFSPRAATQTNLSERGGASLGLGRTASDASSRTSFQTAREGSFSSQSSKASEKNSDVNFEKK